MAGNFECQIHNFLKSMDESIFITRNFYKYNRITIIYYLCENVFWHNQITFYYIEKYFFLIYFYSSIFVPSP